MGIFDDINRDLNSTFAVGQGMADPFQQFLRESGATWQVSAWVVSLYGVTITVALKNLDTGHEGIEMLAPAFMPPAVRVLRRRGWGVAPLPLWVLPLTTLPVVSEDALSGMVVQSDEPEAAALTALAPTWQAVVQTTPFVFLASDGIAVTAQIVPPATSASVHAVAAAVAASARSSGIAQTLVALDGAKQTRSADLAPSVVLLDGIELGVQGGIYLIARLGGLGGVGEPGSEAKALLRSAGDPHLGVSAGVATLTWPTVERDATRIKAGISALRRLASSGGPYR